MSGGAFNYRQYVFEEIADEIERLIERHSKDAVNEYGESFERYSQKTLDRFREAAYTCRRAGVMAQRVDWLVSGDDGEETFIERWDKELNALKQDS